MKLIVATITVAIIAALAHHHHHQNLFEPALRFFFPHGLAVEIPPEHRPAIIARVDFSNDSLRLSSGKLTKIFERIDENDDDERDDAPLLTHPETIIFDKSGKMYIMNENAKLVSLTDFRPMADSVTKNNDDDDGGSRGPRR